MESWTGVLEWNLGGKFRSGADRRNLLNTPSPWFRWHFQFYFVKKETDEADVFSTSLFSLIDFHIHVTSESVVMP